MSNMKKQLLNICFFLVSFSLPISSYSQTLIMNEVSNGPAGNQEYVEFIVIDTVIAYNCNAVTPPCIDIRGWIFDDNSGYHGTGGVAPGAVRFSFDPLWACIPLGTIIVIYNDADPNPNMPANDLSLTDGNCSIIAPINNPLLFERNTTTPGAVACSYPPTGWVAGGAWSTTLLANSGDCARIVNLAGCEVFSVCWATDNLNNLIYFSSGGSGAQNVWYFNNGNPASQANWTEGSTTPAGGSQTPGLPNNPANAAYIAQFNNACAPITPLIVTAISTNAGCTCNGTATATATGSIPGYTYEWFNATFVPIGQTSATASGLCGGTYNVIATSSIGCVDTASVIITSSGAASVTVNNAVICSGAATALTATPLTLGGTYSWSPSGQTTQTILITPTVTTIYTVTYTLAGCSATSSGVVTVNPLPLIAVPDQTVCAGTAVTLSGNGANTYTWTGGITNGLAFTPLATTTYTVTGTITATGCTSTDPATITVNPLPTVGAGLDQTVCAGVAVTLSGSGASTYTWNNAVTNGVAFTPAATATYTVTGTSAAGCINTDQVIVTVNPIPVVSAGPDASICTGGSTTLTATGATTYSWLSGGQLTAAITVSPVATTTYTVTGTSLGCTASDAVTVTILANAPINAGLDVAICLGSSTTLTATGGVTYVWDNGLLLGNNFVISPTATTTYTVVGTNSVGCLGTDAITVTVNPNPSPIITGPSTYCAGNFALLATTTPFTAYSWSTGASSPSINATQLDSPVTVTVTNTFGCQTTTPVFLVSENNVIIVNSTVTLCQGQSSLIHGNNETIAGLYSSTTILASGCDSISNVTLIVNQIPIVNAGPDQVYCGAMNTTLNGLGAATYTWNNGATNGVAFTPAFGTTTYLVTGTSAAGCISTDQVDVIVNPLPVVAAGPDQIVCAGTAVTLTANGATTYTWNNGVTDGIAFTPLATTTYTVTGTSVAGCVNTDQVLVTVNPTPVVFAGNNLVLCEGNTATLNATGANTYTWDNGAVNGAVFIPSLGNATYTVTGTSGAGCLDTDQIDINVASITPVSFIPNLTSGCSPLTVTFTSTTIGATNYTWTMSDGTVITGPESVINTFEEPGCYDISLSITNSNGCPSVFSAMGLVCVEETPIASFNQSTFTVSEFNPTVMFDNNSIDATTYLWDFGDGSATSNQTNPAHDYLNVEFGTYEIILVAISSFGCVDTAYSSIQLEEELIFYVPNTFTPDNDMFNQTFQPIFTSGFDPYDYTLLIFNRWGEVVFESHNTEIGWNGTYGSNSNQGLVQDGTYTWKIEFKTNRNDERKMIVGHVNLVR